MKVGTLSLNINAPDFNYGAILHSYAFQQYLLKDENIDGVEIIDYVTPRLEGQDLASPIFNRLKTGHIKSFFRNTAHLKNYNRRLEKFNKFEEKNMIISKQQFTQKLLQKNILEYDVIICESDVIWAPGFFGGEFDKSFFCAFSSMDEMRKIAYAPSMADGNLTTDQKEEFHRLLKKLDFISTRERYAVGIIKKFTTKPVEHVLDPVFLLNANEYVNIAEKVDEKQDFVLLYLPVDDNRQLRYQASEYAKRKGLRVIEISTKLKNKSAYTDKCIGDAGIEEFLGYISSSSIVFTNSFHAICFAVIFQKQFYAFTRNSSGKVRDICRVLNLENRFIKDGQTIRKEEKIDYEKVNILLEKEIVKSKEWLHNALYSM